MATHTPLYWPYMLHFVTAVRGLTAVEFGLLKSLYYLTCTVAEVPTGVIADRLGRRPALVLAAALHVVGTALIAGARSFGEFAVGEVCIGVGTALMSGADSALLYDSIVGEDRDARYARIEGASRALAMLCMAAALPLTDWLLVRDGDPVWAWWVTAGITTVGVLAALAMVEPRRHRRPPALEITRGALRDVVGVPGLVSLFAYGIGIYVLVRATNMTFYNPVLERAGWPVERFGTFFALVTLVGAATAWLSPRLLARAGERGVLVGLAAGLLLMFGGLATWRHPTVVPALLCLQGAASGLYVPLLRTLVNRRAPSSERRATLLSLESMGSRIVWSGAVVFTGWSLDRLSLDGALVATAALAGVPLAVAWWAWPRSGPAIGSRGGNRGGPRGRPGDELAAREARRAEDG